MIPNLLENNLIPKKQIGKVVTFKRRTAKQSNINSLETKTIDKFYDFIRMLDGEGYPKAFSLFGDLKIKYMDVKKSKNKLTGRFEVIENE